MRDPRSLSGQLSMDAFGGPKRQQPNEIVNEIRQSVARGASRITHTSHRRRATYSTTGATRSASGACSSATSRRVTETAIYLTEAAEKLGDTKALNVIRDENVTHNGGLPEFAFKMATRLG